MQRLLAHLQTLLQLLPLVLLLLIALAHKCAHVNAEPTDDQTERASATARQPVWQLSGALLSPHVEELEHGDCDDSDAEASDCAFFRLSWSAPPIVAAAAPPLLYSVFAEWDERSRGGGGSDSNGASPTPLPDHLAGARQSQLVCETSSSSWAGEGLGALSCRAPLRSLPRGVPLELHLLTECDHSRLYAEAGARPSAPPRCRSAVSPTVRVVLPPTRTARIPDRIPPAHQLEPTRAGANDRRSSTASQVLAEEHGPLRDDSFLRAALTSFYAATSTPSLPWDNKSGWLNPSVPACQWHGVQCDEQQNTLVGLALNENSLSSRGCVDLSDIFASFTAITLINLAGNPSLCLSRLDLRLHSRLQGLNLGLLGVSGEGPQTLLLPDPSSLTMLDLSGGAWSFNLSSSPLLQILHLTNSKLPFHLSSIPVPLAAPFSPLVGVALNNVRVRGDLNHLCPMPNLSYLYIENSGLSSMLPANLSACWPRIDFLELCCSNLYGPLPPFVGLPRLASLELQKNSLTGSIQLDLPAATLVKLANNQLSGALPSDFFSRLPSLERLDLKSNLLQGPVPSSDRPRHLALLTISLNQFSGPLPENVTAVTYDLSYNRLSGPLIFRVAGHPFADTKTINLAMTYGLECPIQLGEFTDLHSLDLRGAGFDGCDFADPDVVQLPHDTLRQLDLSHNRWLPMALPLYPSLERVAAIGASVHSFTLQSEQPLSLQDLLIDDSTIGVGRAKDGLHIGIDQAEIFKKLLERAPALQYLSCNNCSLQNAFTGPLSVGTFSMSNPLIPATIKHLDFSYNPQLEGHLPPAGTSYTSLREMNFAGTSVSGALPKSWSAFSELQHLTLSDTKLQCPLMVNQQGQLHCALPPWLSVSGKALNDGTREDGGLTPGFHCPGLDLTTQNFSTLVLDETYYARTLCTCDTNYFGRDGVCVRCPAQCMCNGDVIRNCFPVVQRGRVLVSPSTAPERDHNDDMSVLAGPDSVQHFSVDVFLPCPHTLTGFSLCNPEGVSWPAFYDVVMVQGEEREGLAVSGAERRLVAIAEREWCYPGHTGRMCAQCSAGWFRSGRWCAQCLPTSVHVVIILANIALILLLVAVLYARMPNANVSMAALREYEAQQQQQHKHQPPLLLPSEDSPSASEPIATTVHIRDDAPSPSDGSASAHSQATAAPANPLKLLIFHSQQLSLLLHTSASMPPVLGGFLSILSTGSSGFSLSSLFALECVSDAWTMANRCWLALAAPAIVGVAGLGVRIYDQRVRSRAGVHRAVYSAPASDHEDAADGDAQRQSDLPPSSSSQSRIPRLYGVCVSLLYLLVFPCAESALSALTCTDLREDKRDSGGPARSFLNLSPWQQCDEEWQRTILPPALIGVLFWFFAFPIGSTLLFRRLRQRLTSQRSSAAAEAAEAHESAVSIWPLCSDLLRPFSRRYWYWEQVLLVRRLLLVAGVAIIPSSSLYLPLALFSLIQVSALLQHWAHPFRHSLLNSAELASLYLLLLNYITALVLQTDVSLGGGFAHSGRTWTVLLFLANLIFLLVLVGALFQFARTAATSAIVRVRLWLCFCVKPHRAQRVRRHSATRSSPSNLSMRPVSPQHAMDQHPHRDAELRSHTVPTPLHLNDSLREPLL